MKSSQNINAKKKRTSKIKLEYEKLNDGVRILHSKCDFKMNMNLPACS